MAIASGLLIFAHGVSNLYSLAGRLYAGLTEDTVSRVAQHNAGESKWTAKYRPWVLAWQSEELDLSAARKLENLLKRQKGGDAFYRLTGLSRPGSSGS